MCRYACILGLFVSTSALATEQSAVAVLDIQGTGVDVNLLPTLTEVLTVEVNNLGMYKVIAGRDVQAMLGFEKQKDVVGCTDAACLAEIGGALGVDRIVASHIGRVGSTYVVNIKLINIRMADTEGRVYETVRGEVDALISTIAKAVQTLLGAGSRAAAALAPEASAAAQEPESAAPAAQPPPQEGASGDERQVAAAPTTPPPPVETVEASGGRAIGGPVALWVVGGLSLVSWGGFAYMAKSKADCANELADEEDYDDVYAAGAQACIGPAKTFRTLSYVTFTIGAAAILGGVLWFALSGGDDGALAVSPMLGDDTFGLAFSGNF